ncbi:MAG: transcriptional repressor [Candidatus Competibacteraceae bacterium]|nr:transcriptional repressor [Candidatus Competibacteraceae bacterium]
MAHVPKLTRQQSLVLDALSHGDGPASAYVLLEQLHSEGFRAPPQVYRALEKLIGYGLVHRLESINSFVACAHPHEHNNGVIAFAICDSCGHVEEFTDTAVTKRLKGWSNDHAFRLRAAAIELHGTCKNCQTP